MKAFLRDLGELSVLEEAHRGRLGAPWSQAKVKRRLFDSVTPATTTLLLLLLLLLPTNTNTNTNTNNDNEVCPPRPARDLPEPDPESPQLADVAAFVAVIDIVHTATIMSIK